MLPFCQPGPGRGPRRGPRRGLTGSPEVLKTLSRPYRALIRLGLHPGFRIPLARDPSPWAVLSRPFRAPNARQWRGCRWLLTWTWTSTWTWTWTWTDWTSADLENPAPPLQGSDKAGVIPRVPDPACAGSYTLGYPVAPFQGAGCPAMAGLSMPANLDLDLDLDLDVDPDGSSSCFGAEETL